MTLDNVSQLIALLIALLSLVTVFFNAGKWSAKIDRSEKHVHDLRNLVNTLPSSYISKEIYQLEYNVFKDQYRELLRQVRLLERQMVVVTIALHKADIIASTNHLREDTDEDS